MQDLLEFILKCIVIMLLSILWPSLAMIIDRTLKGHWPSIPSIRAFTISAIPVLLISLNLNKIVYEMSVLNCKIAVFTEKGCYCKEPSEFEAH